MNNTNINDCYFSLQRVILKLMTLSYIKGFPDNNVDKVGLYFSSSIVSILVNSSSEMMSFLSIAFAVPKHRRYIFSAWNSASLIRSTSESIRDITGVGAILSLGVAVGGECLTAVWAGVLIDRLLIQPFRMLLPPLDAAFL